MMAEQMAMKSKLGRIPLGQTRCWRWRLGTNEYDTDSDDDIPDGEENPDGDSLPTWFELKTGSDLGDDGSDNDLEDGFGDAEESQDTELDGRYPDSNGDGIEDGEDPFINPKGCTDIDTNIVSHAYNSYLDGTFHILTVRYYSRQCLGVSNQILHKIEQVCQRVNPVSNLFRHHQA